jgi:hypothetical protein
MALFLIMFSSTLSGCFSGSSEFDCNEEEYWDEWSADSPYPGLDCESGPSKTLSLTIFVYKDNEGIDWLIETEQIVTGIELINSVYNPHNINFILGEVININQSFPDVNDEEESNPEVIGNSSDNGGDYGDGVSINQLGESFRESYNKSNVNVVLVSDGWGAYSMFPWYNQEYYVTFARASTFNFSYIPAHEIGHFLGLYHTHQNHQNVGTDSDLNNALSWTEQWVIPLEECYSTGDFVCDTPYDCYTWCEEDIDCSASDLYNPNPKPGDESDAPQCTAEQHNPSLSNLMSRYGDRQEITDDQGARARYFIQYMSENERNGNQLILIE